MHFTPTIDLGNIITVVLALIALYGAGRKWVGMVDVRFKTLEDSQSATDKTLKSISAQVEKLDVQLDQQNLVLARMESSVVDPLRRFAALELECSKQAKDIIRLQTHLEDTDKRLDEAVAEVKRVRDNIHKVANDLQVALSAGAIASLKSERAGS